jgi:hypothetical protein
MVMMTAITPSLKATSRSFYTTPLPVEFNPILARPDRGGHGPDQNSERLAEEKFKESTKRFQVCTLGVSVTRTIDDSGDALG